MYKKGFFITKEVGNNEFSYNKRKNKKLYISSLIEIDNIDNIQLQTDKNKIAFEDYDFNGELSSNYGLKNFYKIKGKKKDVYLFDNHNHAYYFWYLARNEGVIGDDNTLIHVDEHADTRDCTQYLLKPESQDLEKVFKFTNEVLNVGNYIIPAQKEGIIGNIIQIRNTINLEDYLKNKNDFRGDIILNLDLDFFQPDLDFIDYKLKKKVILDVAKKAKIITVASSPFFMNQDKAIKIFKDIFYS